MTGCRGVGVLYSCVWGGELLNQCQHHRVGSHDCSHAEDAGVVCGVEIKGRFPGG